MLSFFHATVKLTFQVSVKTHLIFRCPVTTHQQQLSNAQSNYQVLMDSGAVWLRDTAETCTHKNQQNRKYECSSDSSFQNYLKMKNVTGAMLTHLQSFKNQLLTLIRQGFVKGFSPIKLSESTLWFLWLTPQQWRGWRWRGGHTETLHNRWTSEPAELFRSLGSSDTETHTKGICYKSSCTYSGRKPTQ